MSRDRTANPLNEGGIDWEAKARVALDCVVGDENALGVMKKSLQWAFREGKRMADGLNETSEPDAAEGNGPFLCALTPPLPPGMMWAVQVVKLGARWATVFSSTSQHFTIAERDTEEECSWFKTQFETALAVVKEMP